MRSAFQVIETVEPGLTQRRGISLFERFLESFIPVIQCICSINKILSFHLQASHNIYFGLLDQFVTILFPDQRVTCSLEETCMIEKSLGKR